MHEDGRLVSRMLEGDEAAFDEAFERHFPPLYRFALSRLRGDADAAEEAVQAALCRAFRKLHTYRGEAGFYTWLCTFCRHEISAVLRRRGLAPATLAEDDPFVRAALESLAAPDGPGEEARRGELSRLVQVTLDALPHRYGDTLEWKYLDGLPVAQIAERLGVGPKAAESHLTRARAAFREAFATLAGSQLVPGRTR